MYQTLWQMLYMLYMCCVSLFSQQPYDVGTIITPTLQMKSLKTMKSQLGVDKSQFLTQAVRLQTLTLNCYAVHFLRD